MSFTRLTAADFANTLTRRLIPAVDNARDLATKLGMRPYQVRRVWTLWTGGRRGVGHETVQREELVEPTPEVGALDALTEQLTAIGIEEQGDLVLDKISARYTEEDLRGFTVTENGEVLPLEDAQQFYYEVEFFTSGAASYRRRFSIVGSPSYDPGRVLWSVRLARVGEDRTRDGEVSR